MTSSSVLRAFLIAAVSMLSHVSNVALAQANESANTGEIPAMGFVHLNRIFSESAYVESVRQRVTTEFTERETALKEKIDELTTLRKQSATNQLAQTAVQKDSIADNLNEMEREIKREERNISEAKRERFEQANKELEDKVLASIKDVASARKVFIVLELSAVLFAEKRLDLTEEVIAMLDSEVAVEEQTKTQ